MRMSRLLIAGTLLLTSCKPAVKNETTSTTSKREASNAAPVVIDACSLITNEEVGSIQKATIYHATSSRNDDGSNLTSLCYYSSREPNQSVSFALTEPGARSSGRDYWEKVFGKFKEEDKEKREGREEEKGEEKQHGEEEEEGPPPRRITGLGEEAFWSGSRFGGALYILKGDFVLRLSVGGGDNEEVKIERSRSLAQKALSRL